MDSIKIKGARTHNLKNIDIEIPRDKFVVITGLSGSGKSSLAFDTIYAEGQRRYIESLSSYARQFLSMMDKPDIDSIEGLSPAISIEQKSTSYNPRSTVGTTTEIYDYLRLLFARVGTPFCPTHNIPLEASTVSQMVDKTLKLSEGRYMITAPIVIDRKGEYQDLIFDCQSKGYTKFRIDGKVFDADDLPKLQATKKHTIEVVVDRLRITADSKIRLADSFESALNLTENLTKVIGIDDENIEIVFSSKFSCVHCGYSVSELEPKLFSFNNPYGSCSECDGIGFISEFDVSLLINWQLSINEGAILGLGSEQSYFYQSIMQAVSEKFNIDLNTPFGELPHDQQDVILNGSKENIVFYYINDYGKRSKIERPFRGISKEADARYKNATSKNIKEHLGRFIKNTVCKKCGGSRLNETARNVFVGDANIPKIVSLPINDAIAFFKKLKLLGKNKKISQKIIEEIVQRLEFLSNVGLDYLSLDRATRTLSGGEAQRIRLASQIGSALVGVMYILDEPSIGLHQRDNSKLLKTLKNLRDLGNTIIVVEHDEDAIRDADFIIDIGPLAGVEGGKIVAKGDLQTILASKNSLTADYLNGKRKIAIPKRLKVDKNKQITLIGATGNNLKNVNLTIPIGLFTCVTGVSGSGKSTLINGTLYPLATGALNGVIIENAPFKEIKGLEYLDKCVNIDQNPIGRTPRSNPATYIGLFTLIRELFASTNDAKLKGYNVGRFSFNVKGGRCEACTGDGLIKVEMHFLPDVYVPCDICKGDRYNRETLEVKYKNKNIANILQMTVAEAIVFFDANPPIKRKLQALMDVGLSYITLGQSSTTLSGGEAQRIKLAGELARKDTGKTLYILDEPTTGLHFYDIDNLLKILRELKSRGNTIVVIEHNLDVIKTADYVVDLGYEGGAKGGEIIATGTPEQIALNKQSYTGIFLKHVLHKG